MTTLVEELRSTGNKICDHPAALTDFNGVAYMGTWYEIAHVSGQPF